MSTHMIRRRCLQRGFSLIELMAVIAILTLVMGVVFRQIITVQQRYRGEEAKLDITQESREFLDQMARDLHQAGYPTKRIYSTPPNANSASLAVGLVSYAYDDLWFEGDVDGDGQVDVVEYRLLAQGGTCPCIIQRRQTIKIDGTAPLNQTASTFSTELQDVISSGGSYTITGTGPGGVTNQTLYGALASPRIFQAFNAQGTAVAPADISTAAGATALGSIRSIKITINVLAKQSASDLQTGRRSAVSMTATARVPNY